MAQLALVAARAPLTAESYRRCRDELLPGQLKRVSVGPARTLVGYVVACPACGAARPYLDDDVGFREAPGPLPPLVGAEHSMPCACGLRIWVVGGALEAHAA